MSDVPRRIVRHAVHHAVHHAAHHAARRASTLVAGAAIVLAACAPRAPRAVDYGREACDFCRMTITDPRYGAELQSRTGKLRAFDSIECLASFAAAQAAGEVRGAWVSDWAHPGVFVAVDSATFWRVGGPASPMGKGLVATAGRTAPRALGDATPLRWRDVLALVAREGMRRGSGHAD